MSGKFLYGPFDIEQFDPVAADLDAVVLAATEFEQSVGVDPPPVPGPHQPSSVAVKVRGEALAVSSGSRQ